MVDNENRLVRSFGRIKSRKLSDNKQDLLENKFPNEIPDLPFFA